MMEGLSVYSGSMKALIICLPWFTSTNLWRKAPFHSEKHVCNWPVMHAMPNKWYEYQFYNPIWCGAIKLKITVSIVQCRPWVSTTCYINITDYLFLKSLYVFYHILRRLGKFVGGWMSIHIFLNLHQNHIAWTALIDHRFIKFGHHS